MSATPVEEPLRVIGADGVAPRRGGGADPTGATHVVHGWMPVCGAPRVRFVFPGRTPDDVTDLCRDCAASAGAAGGTAPRSRAGRAS